VHNKKTSPIITEQSTRHYRPDIDGLRAIAVLFILLFHLDFILFSGGYIGVDVFFVISGYLITQLIIRESDMRVFSFKSFYLRRLRRLFPAFAFTLLAVYFFSYLLLSPEHTLNSSWASQASLLFGVNFWFWRDSGYFSIASDFRPLLHFWSLSVEEQFYFIWPGCLILLIKFTRALGAQLFLLTAAAFSLFLCEKMLKIDPDAAFYLTQYRAYEFSIGAILVWVEKNSWKVPVFFYDVIFVFSLSMLLYAAMIFTPETKFPGISALIPTLSAAGMILSGKQSRLRIVTSNKLMVGIGLLSYSLYLIHWPVIVFYDYLDFSPLTTPEKILILIISGLLSMMMYFYIELPIKKIIPDKKFIINCCALGVILAVIGMSSIQSDGWKFRISETTYKNIESTKDLKQKRNAIVRAGRCDLTGIAIENYNNEECLRISPDKRNILVIGDSHAADIYMTLAIAFPEVNFLQATAPGCRPIIGENHGECNKFTDKVFNDFIFKPEIDGVVMAANWEIADLERLDKTLIRVKSTKKQIILFGPGISFNPDISTLLARKDTNDDINKFAFRFINPDIQKIERVMQVRYGNEVDFLKRTPIQCQDICDVMSPNGNLYYWDGSHLSADGAQHFASMLLKKYGDVFSHGNFGKP